MTGEHNRQSLRTHHDVISPHQPLVFELEDMQALQELFVASRQPSQLYEAGALYALHVVQLTDFTVSRSIAAIRLVCCSELVAELTAADVCVALLAAWVALITSNCNAMFGLAQSSKLHLHWPVAALQNAVFELLHSAAFA